MMSKNRGPVYDLIVVMDRQAGVRTLSPLFRHPLVRASLLAATLHRVGFSHGCLEIVLSVTTPTVCLLCLMKGTSSTSSIP